MSSDVQNSTPKQVSQTLMRLIRDNIFGGQELVLIEPFNGPRPAVTHALVHFISARMHEHPITWWEDREDGYFEVLRGTRYCRYRIGVVGEGADEIAVNIQNYMRSVGGAEFDMGPIIGFGKIQEIQEYDARYLAIQEDRVFFNVDLYAKFGSEYPWVDIANVSGTFNRNYDPNDQVEFLIEKT